MIVKFENETVAVPQTIIYTAGNKDELVLVQVYNQPLAGSAFNRPEPTLSWTDGTGAQSTQPSSDLGFYTFTLKLKAGTSLTVQQEAPPTGTSWSFYIGLSKIDNSNKQIKFENIVGNLFDSPIYTGGVNDQIVTVNLAKQYIVNDISVIITWQDESGIKTYESTVNAAYSFSCKVKAGTTMTMQASSTSLNAYSLYASIQSIWEL